MPSDPIATVPSEAGVDARRAPAPQRCRPSRAAPAGLAGALVPLGGALEPAALAAAGAAAGTLTADQRAIIERINRNAERLHRQVKDLQLLSAVDAVKLSRATFRKIKQNLFFAFFYNVLGIPLAAAGLLNPVIAGAAMAMSSVSVVSNSLLLKRWRPQHGKR